MVTGHEERSSHSPAAETVAGLALMWKLEVTSYTLVAGLHAAPTWLTFAL